MSEQPSRSGIQAAEPNPSQEELAHARDLALAASRKKSEYVASISHELRTPMNGILGMASLLLDTALDAEQKEYVETIHGAAESLLGLLNEVLDLSKLEAGRLEIQAVPFDLNRTCEEVLRLLRPRADQAGIDLRFDYDEGAPRFLIGDPHRIRQVLVNLIGNALKFTTHGHVRLGVDSLERDARRALIRLEVEDTGIGIPGAQLESIFQPFSQVPGDSVQQAGGTGLGLAISQRLVTLMNSHLQVRSDSGEGSTFWVELDLPVDRDRPDTPPSTGSPPAVLLVLADAQRRAAWLQVLDRLGIGVDTVSSADAALETLGRTQSNPAAYRSVLVDYHLPDLDGETLGRTLSSRLCGERTAIFLLPPPEVRFDAARLRRSGFVAALSAPEELQQWRDQLTGSLATERAAGLPVQPEPKRPTIEHGTGMVPRPRVLVVEDNLVNQKVVVHMLRKQGFEVALAEDGRQGVEMFTAGDYDLVLMDCQMPIMDGYEATRRIRAIGDGKGRTPIIALTANAMDGDREKCIAAGMDDYMSKPAKANQLGEMLRKWIPNCSERLHAPSC